MTEQEVLDTIEIELQKFWRIYYEQPLRYEPVDDCNNRTESIIVKLQREEQERMSRLQASHLQAVGSSGARTGDIQQKPEWSNSKDTESRPRELTKLHNKGKDKPGGASA